MPWAFFFSLLSCPFFFFGYSLHSAWFFSSLERKVSSICLTLMFLFYFKWLLLLFNYTYVCAGASAVNAEGVPSSRTGGTVRSYLMWVLKIELGSLARTVRDLNRWAVYLSSSLTLLFFNSIFSWFQIHMEKSDPFTCCLYKKEQEGISFSYLYQVCLFAACNPTTLNSETHRQGSLLPLAPRRWPLQM